VYFYLVVVSLVVNFVMFIAIDCLERLTSKITCYKTCPHNNIFIRLPNDVGEVLFLIFSFLTITQARLILSDISPIPALTFSALMIMTSPAAHLLAISQMCHPV